MIEPVLMPLGFRLGYVARKYNSPKRNPFKDSEEDHWAWERGWDFADKILPKPPPPQHAHITIEINVKAT